MAMTHFYAGERLMMLRKFRTKEAQFLSLMQYHQCCRAEPCAGIFRLPLHDAG